MIGIKNYSLIIFVLFLLLLIPNANADLFLTSRAGSIYFNTTGIGRAFISPGGNLTLLGTANLSVPGNVYVGGGYLEGGITLVGAGSDKGSAQIGKDILLDGQIVAITDIEINRSFVPVRDSFSILGNHSNRFLNIFAVNVLSGNQTLVLNANASITGNLTVDTSTLVVDEVNNRVGIGKLSPNYQLDVAGQINASALNITGNARISALASCTAVETDSQGNLICGTDDTGSVTAGTALNVTNLNASGQVLLATGTQLVGIGKVGPTYLLDVGTGTAGKDVNLSGFLYVNSSSGGVGIGKERPNYPLDVAGQINASALNITGNARISALVSCTAVETDSQGNLICGTDDTGSVTVGTALNVTQLNASGQTLLAIGSGNVGIGTDEPKEKLVVAGNVNISGTLNASGRIAFPNVASQSCLGTDSGGVLQAGTCGGGGSSGQWNSSGLNLYLNNSNYLVGIGTPLPESKLHVRVNDTANTSMVTMLILDHLLQDPLNSTGGVGIGVLFRSTDNGSNIDNVALINASLVSATNGSESSSLGFYTRALGGALTPIIFINGTNVGINTTAPNKTLHVKGDAEISGKLIVAGDEVNGFTNISLLYGFNQSSGQFAPIAVTSDGALELSIVDDGGTNIIGSGATGIDLTLESNLIVGGVFNVTNTTRNATFQGDVRIIGTLYGGSPLKIGGGVNITAGSGQDALFVSDSAGNKIFRISDTGAINITSSSNTSFDNTTLFIDTTNERIGIGNDKPNVTLHVSGRANITGYLEVGKGLNVSNGMNVLSGNAGIGTNSPQNRLEVVGSSTFAGGINASSLNVTGFSIADDSLVTLSDGSKKKIKDIKAGQYILSLDENTGKLVARKVNALLDHGIKPIYEMATESGRSINTTGEHPYFVKFRNLTLGIGDTSKSPSFNVIKYPSKSSGFDLLLSKIEKDFNKASGLSCGIVNQTIEKTFSFENEKDSVKSKSLVTSTRFSSLESSANLPLESPFGLKEASYPSDFRNFNNSFFTFSSSRNLSCERDSDGNIISSSCQVSGIMQSCLDMLPCEGCYEACDYLFSRHSTFKHFQNLPDHYSSAFESGLSMADFAVRDNVLVDFDSHNIANNNEVFKPCAQWIEVRYLKIGDKIAVPDYENCGSESDLSNKNYVGKVEWPRSSMDRTIPSEGLDAGSNVNTENVGSKSRRGHTVLSNISDNNYKNLSLCGTIKFEKITSIKTLDPQHVYDLSIEGTRNFIANDIVAHNTYLATASGNVGIGTTTPNQKLVVIGTVNITQGLNVTGGARVSELNAGSCDLKADSDGNFYCGSDATGSVTAGSALNVTQLNASGQVLLATASGNVGIGTTSPTHKLHVVDTSQSTQARFEGTNAQIVINSTNTDTNKATGVRFSQNTGNKWIVGPDAGSGTGTANFEFYDYQGTAGVRMVIQNTTGNVGIGTTSPNYLLQVASGTDGRSVNLSNVLYVNASSGKVGIRTTAPNATLHISGSGTLKIGDPAVTSGFIFTEDSLFINIDSDNGQTTQKLEIAKDREGSTGGTSLMVIQEDGNVGIGTTKPGIRNGFDAPWLTIASPNPGIILNDTDASAEAAFMNINAGGRLEFGHINTDGTENTEMVISTTGNVGINTTNPAQTLTIQGTLNITPAGLKGAENVSLLTTPEGRVYIGSNSPGSGRKLSVVETGPGNAAFAVFIHNDGASANSAGIELRVGADDAAGTNSAIEFQDGDGGPQGDIVFTSGTVSYRAFTASHLISVPVEFNEKGYPYGTLVCIKSLILNRSQERSIKYDVEACKVPYAKNILGAYAGKDEGKENQHHAYVLGDGHILINNENGNIEVGDAITTSSKEGIGMKATQAGMTTGVAQESYDFRNASETKLIAVQYGLRYYIPQKDIDGLKSENDMLKQRISALEKAR